MKSKSALEAGKEYFVLSTVYDAETNSAGIKLYDVENKKGIYATDTYGHEPYCYSRNSLKKIQATEFPPGTVRRVDSVRKRDLLNEIDDDITRIVTLTPNDVPKVRDLIGETWESKIKYHQNWIYDVQIVPGRRYWWNPDQKKFIQSRSMSSGMDIPKNIIEYLNKELIEVFQDDFTQEIPEIPIVACDIETEYTKGQIPQATDPIFRIICICFADNQDNEIALVLERKGIEKGDKPEKLSLNVHVERFTSEHSLLKRAFEVLKEYPIVATFNGDNFDFPYLHERAKHLKVGSFSPIKWDRRNKVCNFPKLGVHLDLYRFYHNVAIRSYAFGNRYQKEDLDTIAQSLLGIGKIPLSKEISDLTEWELISYCARDAKITLNLLLFDDQTPLNLIFVLSRISRMPIDDLVRTSVSNWVRSLLYYEHRRRGFLIPNQKDLLVKGTHSSSEAIIKGKKYKGARVIDPVPGVHFDVAVMDFACLDEETEILTYEGWKNKEDIRENDQVLTLNVNTKRLEYNKVLKRHEYDYNGDMYHLDTDSIEQFITPNHRVLYFDRNRKKEVKTKMKWKGSISISEVKDMEKYWYAIPYSGNWERERRKKFEFNGISLDMDSFLAVYGIFLSDGGVSSNGRAINIYQSKEPELTKIRKIIEYFCTTNGYKFTENEYRSGQGRKYTVLRISNKSLAQTFSRLLKEEPAKQQSRFIHRDLLMLNIEQLQILWNSLMLGDGSKGKYKGKECYRSYGSVSKQLVDDVQELSIKLGIGAKLSKEIRNPEAFGRVYKNHVSYRVFHSYERRNVISKQSNPIHFHPYKGKVWCVSTKNGTIMIRRNGKVSITGNSLYPSIIGTFNLSYETINCSHNGCKNNTVPQTNYWVCQTRRGIIADIIGFIKDVRVLWLKPESKKETPHKNYLQILERSLKVLINASYGVIGSDRFPLYCLPVADSTTAYGRDAIEKTIQKAQSLNIQVLYGDTDSVFLHKPNKEQINEIIEWSQKDLGVRLEMEKVYRYVVLSERKKNYFGVYPDSNVDVKGLMGKKRNTPSFLQEGFKQVIKILSQVKTNEEFDKAKNDVKELVRGIYQKLEKNFYSEEDLAITMQLTQPLNRYKVNAQHVKAANQLEESFQVQYKIEHDGKRRRSPFIKAGKLIRFVKTRTGDRVTPVELMTEKSKVDVKAYKSMANSIFDQVFGALDIDVDEISTGQVNLMKFFG
ncbi:MAG: DNA polymerase domain-containing protein [Candidatus Hodarchaeales archaeon]